MLRKINYILIILLAFACSCTDNAFEGPMGPTEQVITVSPTEAILKRDETATFTAVGGTGTYYWEVSQPDIGSIDSSGVFTALKDGEATIICRDSDNLTGTAKVTVEKHLVRVTPDFPSMDHNSTITFTASGGITTTYFWWCDPPTLYGTISQQGIFTSKNINGTCVVYAADGSNNVGVAHLIIKGVSISVSPSTVALHAGDSQGFEALGGTEAYTWTSSNTSVGVIEPTGKIVTFTALAEGTTTITVTDSDNFTGSANVTVVAGVAGTILVLPSAVSVQKTDTYQFTATGGSGSYTWNMSNPSIGTISSSGLFTAGKNSGTATITATDTLGNVGTATASVVNSTITISPGGVTMAVAAEMTFVATGGTGTYWWSTTSSAIAEAETQTAAQASITVTGVAVGTTTLYAVDENGNTGSVSIKIQ